MARIFLSLGLQLLLVQLPFAAALDNGVARTPPLGWCSWQRYRCAIGCNDATSSRAAAAEACARRGAGITVAFITFCVLHVRANYAQVSFVLHVYGAAFSRRVGVL